MKICPRRSKFTLIRTRPEIQPPHRISAACTHNSLLNPPVSYSSRKPAFRRIWTAREVRDCPSRSWLSSPLFSSSSPLLAHTTSGNWELAWRHPTSCVTRGRQPEVTLPFFRKMKMPGPLNPQSLLRNQELQREPVACETNEWTCIKWPNAPPWLPHPCVKRANIWRVIGPVAER